MGRDERLGLIEEIEAIRNAKIICYLTGDRPNYETNIAKDVIHLFYDHLADIGDTDRIDLFLYTRGGDTLAAFALVNHIREFCEHFGVLIPYKAHSAGTLITLGANEIIMGKLGELSPIDPSVTTPYNPTLPEPQSPTAAPKFLPVNVEEVMGFFNLAKNEIKLLSESSLIEVFKELASKVHPLSLGTVYRAREQIGMLAQKLLEMHYPEEELENIQKIIDILTKELYSHDYLITRTEAKKLLKLSIVNADGDLETKMWSLYKAYEKDLELTTPFSSEVFLGTDTEKTAAFRRVYIESTSGIDVYLTKKAVKKVTFTPPGAPGPQEVIQEKKLFDGWSKTEA